MRNIQAHTQTKSRRDVCTSGADAGETELTAPRVAPESTLHILPAISTAPAAACSLQLCRVFGSCTEGRFADR